MNRRLIQIDSLNNFLQDDQELLADLAVVFARNVPTSIARLRLALDRADCPDIGEQAHQLKGKLAYFFCSSLVESADELEHQALQGNVRQASEVAASLVSGISDLIEELNEMTGLELVIDKE